MRQSWSGISTVHPLWFIQGRIKYIGQGSFSVVSHLVWGRRTVVSRTCSQWAFGASFQCSSAWFILPALKICPEKGNKIFTGFSPKLLEDQAVPSYITCKNADVLISQHT